MERLKEERDKLAKQKADADKDYEDLMAENERLRKLVEDAESRAKTNKKHIFENRFKIQVEKKMSPEKEETDVQKQMRERFEKLEKLNREKGPSLR